MIKKLTLITFFILSVPLNASAEKTPNDWANHLINAYERKASIPVLSDQLPQLDRNRAWRIGKNDTGKTRELHRGLWSFGTSVFCHSING